MVGLPICVVNYVLGTYGLYAKIGTVLSEGDRNDVGANSDLVPSESTQEHP
jgi:hypothetical protein